MKRIYLARHGQDKDNARGILNGHRDLDLTTIGKQQAKDFAKNLKQLNLGITKIYSSPLKRAYSTAFEASKILGLDKPEKLDLLIERDFGYMTGKLISQINELPAKNLIKTKYVNYIVSGDGVETFPQLKRRVEKFFSWLNKNDKNENILIVCHGDLGKMIYSVFYNLSWKNTLSRFHFGNTEIILLEKGTKLNKRLIYQTKQKNS